VGEGKCLKKEPFAKAIRHLSARMTKPFVEVNGGAYNERTDMLVQCTKCGKEIAERQSYEHQGNLFCEDCYMDVLSPPKACDPWAVHSAQTFLRGKDKLSTLTSLQTKIVGYITEKGEATPEEIMANLDLTEEEFRRDFATLRHMEILRGTKKNGKIVCILF